MKSMAYIVLQSYGYNNVLVIKYFCTTTNFCHTYLYKYSDLLNPGLCKLLKKNLKNCWNFCKKRFNSKQIQPLKLSAAKGNCC